MTNLSLVTLYFTNAYTWILRYCAPVPVRAAAFHPPVFEYDLLSNIQTPRPPPNHQRSELIADGRCDTSRLSRLCPPETLALLLSGDN
jgi:hypothetical protein